jgi:DNA (cytosine-5)-methyltransferase 1
MTQQEFVVSVLRYVSETQLSLFPRRETSIDAPGRRFTVPFRFIDLFAGIGGFRLALESLGGKCVMSSEWDRYAQKTYKAWFDEVPAGDIRQIERESIPDHDVLAAGFPCQPFSIAGVSKKKSLGRAHGFGDVVQGNLFFDLAAVIKAKRPPVVFLENVKNLKSHDGGRTWKVIHDTLVQLRYRVFHKVIDAIEWVPQHRERIYIVCFDRDIFPDSPPFQFPIGSGLPPCHLGTILEPRPDPKYTLSDHLWQYLQDYRERHESKGNGFGFGLAPPQGTTRTLSARYYKDGSEILVPQRGRNPRRLTPRECARLMGFPDSLPIVVSDTQAYRQFGNAVVPPVVEAIGREILAVLAWHFGNSCLVKKPQLACVSG